MSLSMLAAAGGHDDILRLLIRKGARVNSRQKNGTTALMHAAEKVRRPLTPDLLLRPSVGCASSVVVTLNCLSEFLDDSCHPARGRILRQRSDFRGGDGANEGKCHCSFHPEMFLRAKMGLSIVQQRSCALL